MKTDLRFTLPTERPREDRLLELLSGKALAREAGEADIALWAKQAAQGDATSQYELARALTSGKALAQNNREAVKWLKKASEKAHAQSEHLLGILIARAQGVRADPEKAHALFKSAAIAGYAPAQYDLARSFAWGFGCEVNAREALTWWRLAAAQGHALSQYESALAYLNGRGCMRDLRQATHYMRKAALGGVKDAAYELAELYMREENPAANPAEAYRWYTEASEDVRAHYALALYIGSGRFKSARAGEALRHALRAAEGGLMKGALLASRLLEKNTQLPDCAERALALMLFTLRVDQTAQVSDARVRAEELTLTLSQAARLRSQALADTMLRYTDILKL